MKKVTAKRINETSSRSEEGNLRCAIAWLIPPISSVYFIVEKKYHSDRRLMMCAWQSLILSILYYALAFTLFYWVINLISLFYFLFLLYAAYKSYQGDTIEVPIIVDIAKKQVEKMSK